MIPGVRGRLITASFARDVLPSMPGFASPPSSMSPRLGRWAVRLEASLGTTSSVRAIADVALMPLLDLLGLFTVQRIESEHTCALRLTAGGSVCLSALTIGWGEPIDRMWRPVVKDAIGSDARWCLCGNGQVLRLVDARRTWSREYLEFDLAQLGHEREAQAIFWALLHAGALSGATPLLDRAVDLSSRHGLEVCKALGTGVLEALEVLLGALAARRPRRGRTLLFEQSLTVLYRVLFLLFAEARGLVPIWHPVYRDRYSLDAIVATLLTGRACRGLWFAVRAISKLAHTGFAAGELRVTAFNGRLFAPVQAEAFENTPISDAVMTRALMAVSTTPVNRHGRRARIVYRDLDVEQLGAVYERVLEYEPASSEDEQLTRTRDLRKASGTFYTPRSMTAFLVRRTLEPLIDGRSADEMLAIRILDPAMGSGAFLVAACRYLSAAAEDALIREGRWHAHDITPADRAGLRRDVASRCLFGVDLNPMAVQLARLSLWLATLAADKPLSFLDHHLLTGNSLVGASPDDVWRYRGRRAARYRDRQELPLFDRAGLTSAVEHAVRLRLRVASEPDDTAAIVRAKERTIASLLEDHSLLRSWRRVLDLWCAAWFWNDGPAPDRATFHELARHHFTDRSALPRHVASALVEQADAIAGQQRFLHWPLAFPEVFVDDRGAPRAAAGFDAIVGNPPWDMVRGDSGDGERRQGRQLDARRLSAFVRESGIYRVDTRVHANLYQWFVERALQLVRPGGRIGFVLPSGLASDTGAAPLRRYLFDRADVDSLTGLDNRDAIFPIHRSVRFILLTCTAGRPTSSIACRFGITRPEELDRDDRAAIALSRAFLTRLSSDDDLGIPDLHSAQDLRIVERISATIPRLAHDDGWHVQFGRELNASDDRDSFAPCTGGIDARPVVEGKQVEPFRVSLDTCRLQLRPDVSVTVPRRARLAYRDVASATNRLTLIAAIVPARAVTTHTLFCLKTRLAIGEQQVLCALLNSFVANYLIRMRVNTHVTVALVSKLPVPVIRAGHPLFERLCTLTESLMHSTADVEHMPEYAELQALIAAAYGVTVVEFEHVLSTFPLIPRSVKDESLERALRRA
ncbi:MAG TPA: N-6 DNA methylase [Vicinamibacterales bacterium]|nr:N-6 DNA methylase [Vicinamibacterales bacterium]